nr:hypothetical protein [Tanacetum cinerariifolium]
MGEGFCWGRVVEGFAGARGLTEMDEGVAGSRISPPELYVHLHPWSLGITALSNRRSKQPFILEESPIDTMADQRTMTELLRALTEVYKDLLRACPHHGFTKLHQLDTFYNALNPADKDSLNVAAGGNLLGRHTQDVLTIIETNLRIQDNIQGYVLAAAVNYNQGELKSITTRSGLVVDGPIVSTPPPFINPEVDERVEETLTDPNLTEYTIKVPYPHVQKYKPPSQREYIMHQRDHLHPNISYPSRMLKQKQQEKDEKMLKALLSNKEKLQELGNTPLNENCLAVILKKLREKHGDPGKFLILCSFSELKCKALADLGASINFMPLFVWKKLGLPELISTRMTLELANQAICTPAGIARDVFVLVGKFTFPADFVIVDYESDPRVPLILGRPFLRTARALIDVHGEEMILRDSDERLTLNMRHDTSNYSKQPQKESINLINLFNNSSKDFLEDLFSNQPSGNPTFSSHPELTSPEFQDDIFDLEGGNVLPEKFLDLDSTKDLHPPLYDIDSSLKDSIDQSNIADDFVDSMPEMFTDEHALDYSFPLIFDEYDDDFLEVEFDTENVYDDPFKSKGEKIKESKLLIDELDLLCDFLLPFEYDSFISQDFSMVDATASTNNEDKVNSVYRPTGMANQIRPPGFAQPNVQNNQNRFYQPQGFNRGNNFNLEQSYQAPTQQNQIVPLNELEKVKRMNEANMKAMQTQIKIVKNELRNEMKNSIQAFLSNQTNEIKNMIASLFQMNTASTSGSRSLPSNTIANPKEEDERVEETLTDLDLSEYTIKLHINITLADALILMPKYQKMLKALLSNKEKLQELANIPLNEYCSAVILKKLPKKLRDPGKFLILCGFSELKCKALADLGASINLMPLSVWKKLGLPELISTRMTLKLANRAICIPAGIARYVFVPVGKFTFPADFVIVDYESDPRVPLILGRPFLRTARALIDVHDLDSTKDLHPPLHVNPLSGSTTYSYSSYLLLEELVDELALITFPPKYDDDLQFDVESDLKEIEFLLYQDIDYSLKDLIDQTNPADNFVDSLPEMFTGKHALDYSSPLIFDEYDDDFLEVESDTENVYDDPFDSKGEKIKESKLMIDELDLPCDFLLPSEYDSFISQDFSRVDAFPSTNNEDKVFNPGILIQEKPFEIITHVVQDKKLATSNASLVLEDFDPPFYEPLFFKEVPSILGNLKTNTEGFCPPVFISSDSLGNHVSKSNRANVYLMAYLINGLRFT